MLTANDETAPSPTRVFILGDPLRREFHPSTKSFRPGPTKAANDKAAWKPVECNI